MHSCRMLTARMRRVPGGGVVTWSRGEEGVVSWSRGGREVLSPGPRRGEGGRCCHLVLGG